MLLFWPCIWGLTLVYDFSEELDVYLFYSILFFLGSVLMRSAGCIVNDILDKNNNVETEELLLLINERLRKSIDLHKGTLNYWKSNDFEISKRLANVEI